MGTFSIWHWLIVLAIIVLLFGRGRISDIMGDIAEGLKNFKKNMSEDNSSQCDQRKSINSNTEKVSNKHKFSDTNNVG
ncbi:MAG: Sec-independent protein translocase protein TatA [Hyphomicrobiaceae bacterium hypho_1]